MSSNSKRSLVINNGRALVDSRWMDGVDVRTTEGTIEAIGSGLRSAGDDEIDATGSLVVPGFIDVHVHGAAGAMCEDGKSESVKRISSTLAGFGVTGFLATIATLAADDLRRAILAVTRVIGREPGARIHGIHLEGPYLNPRRAGAQAAAWMRKPSIGELEELQALSDGCIRLITLAPELDDAIDFIAAARRLGIVVSLGHSDASEDVARAAMAAGATHVTHLFNAMPGLHHREPGIVGAALTADGISVEVICDGQHLAPATIELVLRSKPAGKVVFVSDAVAALGMPDGECEMFGFRCVVGGGAVRLQGSGKLAGSCLSLDRAVRNVHAWFPRLPLENIFNATSTAAADAIAANQIGRLVEGAAADITLLDAGLEVVATIVGGRVVWRRH